MSIIFSLCSSVLYWCKSRTMDWHVNKSKKYFCHQQQNCYCYSFTGFTELLSVSHYNLAVKFLWFSSIPLSSCHKKHIPIHISHFCEPLWTQRSWDGVISVMTRMWADVSDYSGTGKIFASSLKMSRPALGPIQHSVRMCTGVLYQVWSRCSMNLTS